MWLIVVLLFAALLTSSDVTPPILGFIVGLAFGALFIYKRGWNARGDYDAAAAHRKIDDDNKAGKM